MYQDKGWSTGCTRIKGGVQVVPGLRVKYRVYQDKGWSTGCNRIKGEVQGVPG